MNGSDLVKSHACIAVCLAIATGASADDGSRLPSSVKGLPEGTTLSAVTWWEEGRSCYMGKLLPPALDLHLDLTGGTAAGIVRAGMYRIDDLRAAGNATVKLGEYDGVPGENPFESTVRVERNGLRSIFGPKHPRGGIRMVLPLGRPRQKLTALDTVCGSVRIQIPDGPKTTIIVPNIYSQIGKAVEHPALENARLRIDVSCRNGTDVFFTFSEGNLQLIGEVSPVDGHEKAIASGSFSNYIDFDGSVRWRRPDYPLKDMGMKIVLFSRLSDARIDFEFKNVPIPPPPVREEETARPAAGTNKKNR